MRLHVTLALVVSACAALCVWQVHRALSGNSLSWAYVFEWPFFGGYAVYMWWRLLCDHPDSSSTPSGDAGAPRNEGDEGHVQELEREQRAYNEYLAQLNATGRPKRW